jgi:serine protease Do
MVLTLPLALAARNQQETGNERSQKVQVFNAIDKDALRTAIRASVRSSVDSAVRSAIDSSIQSTVRFATRTALDAALLSAGAELMQAQEGLDDLAQHVQVLNSLDESASWLGVQIAEVTSEKAKELKLPAEHGTALTEIVPDSPAAKAGLKAGDVVLEYNGQHVEGAAQFRRFIRETPAGRSVQLTIWRDGKTQSLSATLGKAQGPNQIWSRSDMAPMIESRRLPRLEIPRFELGGDATFFRRPILGITGDNLSGQLGAYFGAPDGEGVLVREVSSGSPAEKAGIKAGDVLTKVDNDRVRSLANLRDKLVEKAGDKDDKKTATIALLRNHKEMTVAVNIEWPAAPRANRFVTHRRTI